MKFKQIAVKIEEVREMLMAFFITASRIFMEMKLEIIIKYLENEISEEECTVGVLQKDIFTQEGNLSHSVSENDLRKEHF